MTEYIDRKELECMIPDVQPDCWENCGNCNMLSRDDVLEIINEVPAAEVAPVRHGKWKEVEDYNLDSYWRCSICKKEWWLEAGTPTENKMNFCPHCGAKMDEEES